MSRIYHQLRPKKTRGPEVAPSVSRLIFISCHDNARSVTFESGPECRTDTTIWRGLYIHQMSNYPPPPQHKRALKTSDHLMYNLNNLKRGASTQEASPPETLTTNRAPVPHTRNPPKKNLFVQIHLLHKESSVKSGNYNYGIVRMTTLPQNGMLQHNITQQCFKSSYKQFIYCHEVVMFSLSTVRKAIFTRHARVAG